jgi:3-oxoacyl-[acyl-carrier protein] reductase
VIIADISLEGGQRVEREIASAAQPGGATATFLEFDVTKREAWERGLALAREKHGKLDIVVNNAGTTYRKKPSVEVTEEEFDRIYNVNVKSVYWSVAVVMPYFVERKAGAYINTSSVAGMKVRPGQVFYGGTKGFVNTVSASSTV